MRISKKVAEIWLKLFKKIEIYATILDNNVKYNYRKAVTQYMNRFELVVPCHFGLEAVVKREICLLYAFDAADDTPCLDVGGRRTIKIGRI